MLSVVNNEAAGADGRSILDEICREGARAMLATALEAEVDAYLTELAGERDEDGHALVTRNGPLPEGRTRIPVTSDDDWKAAPAIKARLASGYCLRAPAQGACPYANICEHCPSFRTDVASISVLSAQRVDAEALAKDAEARGWIDEADRHRRLITRLDTLLAEAPAG